jgi:hypothetical protein
MTWKQQLKELKLQDIAKRAPDFFELSGGKKMKVKNYCDKTANGLTAAIVDFINFSGGTADIHAIFKSKHLSIEIKIGADKLSPYQLAERERVRNAGGYYFTAKDFESFLEWFKQFQ